MSVNIWGGEKVAEVEPATLTAFGIEIRSRYGKAGELVDMLQFCEGLARLGLDRFISEVFYDSKACLCSFTPADGVDISKETNDAMLEVAEKTITQFSWLDGEEYLGKGVTDIESGDMSHMP